MAKRLEDIVRFRSDCLFNGAVNIDWLSSDVNRQRLAAESFVFHGPEYHGVSQQDVGSVHGHRLQDTASFTRSILHRCFGFDDQPFTLAIAGYGTGKSHLALTLATLLKNPNSDIAKSILSNIDISDATIGSEIRAILKENSHPNLVIAINGMGNFDLTAEITHQVVEQIRSQSLDTTPLDELRPRFKQASSLVKMASEAINQELLCACEVNNIEDILNGLNEQREGIYIQVQKFFASRGMPIQALGGESVKDVIDVVSREYCGKKKPFNRLIILFDEFGRYTEFATVRSQIAGSGVLQDLFEGIQKKSDITCFVGFIQFELNVYVQRVAPEFKNDILRYITRYQSANKAYLSINLETLIAHLLEKTDRDRLDSWFNNEIAYQESNDTIDNLHSWFPQSRNQRLWCDSEQFHKVVRKGCWPLSPYSTWFLFYLASAGKHLQERSALALLADVIQRNQEKEIDNENPMIISPVDIWSEALQQELIGSEESGQQGSITHAYATVYTRHANRLSNNDSKILRSIVISSKMGLRVQSQDEAVTAIGKLSNLPEHIANRCIHRLQYEYNVIEWDDSFKAFDILGDAVPRSQFLSFLRQRVASSFDEKGKSQLFASKAAQWCDILGRLECDFSEQNEITTKEWHYKSVLSNMELLETNIKFAVEGWAKAIAVDEARGTIIYCYVEASQEISSIEIGAKKQIRRIARENGQSDIPILIVLLYDEEGALGQGLAELSVLKESISDEDRVKFGNLINAHKEKLIQSINSHVEGMIKKRIYVTSLKEQIESRRLTRVGTELFQRIYKKVIPFPFDGFKTARGNAPDTCQQLTSEMLSGNLDYDSIISKPAKVKNRAVRVLKDSWGIFTKSGSISRKPTRPVVRSIIEKWDKTLNADNQQFIIGDELKKLFLPPHGANIASAGMIFGLFIAPRADNLVVVKNKEQYAISQIIQDGIFKGKFIDVKALQSIELIQLGDISSEWENLLDEWEQAESYIERYNFLVQASELKNRVPIPPPLTYRYLASEELGVSAVKELKKIREYQDEAQKKIENGLDRDNISLIAWGTVDLVKIIEKMNSEQPLWTEHQIGELQPLVETMRQTIIKLFPDWIIRQAPKGDSPTAVGDFKHKMLFKIGGSLKKLELNKEFEELEERTNALIKDAETAAEARQLIRDVRSWLDQHIDACRVIRIAALRGYKEIGKEYSYKLSGMSRRIDLMELSETRSTLAEFLSKIKDVESEVMKRAGKLWRLKIYTYEDIIKFLTEISQLKSMFEGCNDDLEDFDIMQRVLQTFQRDYNELEDLNLSWSGFHENCEKVKSNAIDLFADEEIPWDIEEVYSSLTSEILKMRKEKSAAWIKAINSDAESISTLSVSDANRLHTKLSNPPSIITNNHAEGALEILKLVERRLNQLEIDWLIEKFRDLTEESKRMFLKVVSEMVDTI